MKHSTTCKHLKKISAAVVLSEYTTAAVTEWEKASYLPAPATIYNHLETSKQYLTQVPEREQKYRY